MRVIKLGGSVSRSQELYSWIRAIIDLSDERIVIVPGGGGFADQVRSLQAYWHFNDSVAHEMAILAMQNMAVCYAGLDSALQVATSLEDINGILSQGRVPVWSPTLSWLDQQNVAHSWDVTSDSLSVIIAQALAAKQLILVKSLRVSKAITIAELVEREIADKAFSRYIKNSNFDLTLSHKDDFLLLSDLLVNN
ncbi:MAG: uridylate kinase [Methylococcales bacterium]|nr:uridylate kinase [Methylococcales bacterium]